MEGEGGAGRKLEEVKTCNNNNNKDQTKKEMH